MALIDITKLHLGRKIEKMDVEDYHTILEKSILELPNGKEILDRVKSK